MNDNTVNMGDAIKQFLDCYHLNRKFSNANVENAWYRITGTYLNKHTKDVRFHNGCLTISIDSAALRNELMYARSTIIEQINKEVGSNAVKEIKFY